MVKPERRTKTDIAAAATIAVVVAVAASLIWWTSDARATISRPAAVAVPTPAPAREVPTSLKQLCGPPPAQPPAFPWWWAEQWLLATDARWTGATQPPVSRSGVTPETPICVG